MSSPQSTSRRLVGILSLLLVLMCLALTVVVVRSRATMAKLKEQSATLQSKLESASLKPSAIPASPQRDQPEPTTPNPPPRAELDSPTVDTAPAETNESQRAQIAEGAAAMMKSPMMQKVIASQTSAVTQMTYGQLMNRLGLSPEEREHLQQLLVEKQTKVQNLGMQLMNPSLAAGDRDVLMQQLSEAWTSGEAKIREFLNDDADYATYQAYNQQEPERKEIGMFEAALPEGTSLDPATADQLATLQSEARKSFPFTVDFYNQQNFGNPDVLTKASIQRFLEEQTQFQSQVAAKAATLLTPANLELYKQNQAAVRQMTTMQLTSIVQLAGGR